MESDFWNALRAELMTFHPHARDVPGGMRFVLTFGATRVGLYVTPIEQRVAILVELGSIGTLDPTEMLEWNGVLSTEAIAIVHDTLVVRAVVDATSTVDEIERRIQLAARVGALIKRGMRRPHQPSLFAHYAQ